MNLLIDWTPLAIAQLQSIYEYIAQDSATGAERVLEQIFAGAERLESYLNMGRPGRVEGTRELVIAGTPFVIPYRIRQNHVEVLAVFHASRKWPNAL